VGAVGAVVGSTLGISGCRTKTKTEKGAASQNEPQTPPRCPPCETQVPARPPARPGGKVRAKAFSKWPLESPAPVYFIPIGAGKSLQVWAAAVDTLFKKLQPEKLIRKESLVAVKQHFGEKGNKGHIKPQLTQKVIAQTKRLGGKPCLVETNTLYKGSRANSFDHMQTARDHGFSLAALGAPVMIIDGLNGQNQQAINIPGKHFKVVFVASDAFFFDSLVALNHVKGHKMSGFGGALKNLAMGLASRAGKLAQHADFKPFIDPKKCINCGDCAVWCPPGALRMQSGKLQFHADVCIGCGQCLTVCPYGAIHNKSARSEKATFMEKMAEYALGGAAAFGGRALYINVVNHVSKLCDCARGKNPVIAPDVGVLASRDPVALDTATLDVCIKKWGKDHFKKLYPTIDSRVTMKHSAAIGLGTTKYNLRKV
jgi:hypothetical protein